MIVCVSVLVDSVVQCCTVLYSVVQCGTVLYSCLVPIAVEYLLEAVPLSLPLRGLHLQRLLPVEPGLAMLLR